MPAQPKLPDGIFADAMAMHLRLTRKRVQGLYVRQRALFAESVVAQLVGGTVVEPPAAAWDVEMPLRRHGRDVRIQVKCSGQRAPYHSPETSLSPNWAKLKEPTRGRDPQFRVLGPGFHCDVFVFARHEGNNIRRGWWFYVASVKTVRRGVRLGVRFTGRHLERVGAIRCEAKDLKRRVTEVARATQSGKV